MQIELLNEQGPPSPNPGLSAHLITGEVRQAVISGAEVPPRWVGKKTDAAIPKKDLEALMKFVLSPLCSLHHTLTPNFTARDASRTTELGADLNETAVMSLLELGLGERHKELVEKWLDDALNMQTAKDDEIQHRDEAVKQALEEDFPRLRDHVRNQHIASVLEIHG